MYPTPTGCIMTYYSIFISSGSECGYTTTVAFWDRQEDEVKQEVNHRENEKERDVQKDMTPHRTALPGVGALAAENNTATVSTNTEHDYVIAVDTPTNALDTPTNALDTPTNAGDTPTGSQPTAVSQPADVGVVEGTTTLREGHASLAEQRGHSSTPIISSERRIPAMFPEVRPIRNDSSKTDIYQPFKPKAIDIRHRSGDKRRRHVNHGYHDEVDPREHRAPVYEHGTVCSRHRRQHLEMLSREILKSIANMNTNQSSVSSLSGLSSHSSDDTTIADSDVTVVNVSVTCSYTSYLAYSIIYLYTI